MNYWADSMLLWSGQALLLLAVLAVAAAFLQRNSAADRHRLWLVGLLAIAVLPAANLFIAALPVGMPVVESVRYVIPTYEPAIALQEAEPALPRVLESALPEVAPGLWRTNLFVVLFVAWGAGVLVSMVRPVRSYVESRRLRAGASIVAVPPFRLLAGHSPQVVAPMLAGIFRPMILLPADIATWARADEQQAMLLHEAAHFERRDHLVNLFQSLLGAILFFHPAVRYALRQLVLERELACDERVLAAGVRSEVYAETLLKVAERSLVTRHAVEPAFHTAGRILERRMTMILNHPDSMSSGSRILRSARTVAVIAVALLLLPDRAITSGVRLAVPMLVAGVPASLGALSAAPRQAVPPGPPVAIAPVAVQPQEPAAATVRLSGTVLDQTGGLVPGVAVRLVNPATGSSQNSVTNEAGRYAFPQVSAGMYTFEARLPGFTVHSRTIQIQSQSVVEDAVLQISPVNTQVQVSVSAPQGPPPAAAAPGPPLPQRIGGDLAMAQLIFSPKPEFPALARATQVQGVVRLLGVIGTDGTVLSVRPDPAHPVHSWALVQAAVDAVKQWRYRPMMLNGVPVETLTTITVDFTMN